MDKFIILEPVRLYISKARVSMRWHHRKDRTVSQLAFNLKLMVRRICGTPVRESLKSDCNWTEARRVEWYEVLDCLLPFLPMKSQKGIHDRHGGRCVTLHRTSWIWMQVVLVRRKSLQKNGRGGRVIERIVLQFLSHTRTLSHLTT